MVSSHGPALQFLGGLDGSSAASLQPEAAGRQLLELAQLPLRCVAFLSETSVAGAGFDGQVMHPVFLTILPLRGFQSSPADQGHSYTACKCRYWER